MVTKNKKKKNKTITKSGKIVEEDKENNQTPAVKDCGETSD